MFKKGKQTRLARAMFDRQVSTLELGNAVGVSHSTISLIKNGWRKPSSLELIKAIEGYLGEKNLFLEEQQQ